MVVVVGGAEVYMPHLLLVRREWGSSAESSISWSRMKGDWVGVTGRRWVILAKS